jgi:hypothetical protein
LNNRNNGMSLKEIVVGAVGVSPIPIIGEICLSSFFCGLLDRVGMREMKYAGIPTALLMRLGLYQNVYFPLYQGAMEMIS